MTKQGEKNEVGLIVNPVQVIKAVHKYSIVDSIELKILNKKPKVMADTKKVITSLVTTTPLESLKVTDTITGTNLDPQFTNNSTKLITKDENKAEPKSMNDLYNDGLDDLLLSGDLIKDLK